MSKMKILRINTNRDIQEDVERIEIEAFGKKYTLTAACEQLHIHAHDGSINVHPYCSNEISISVDNSF